MILNDLYDFLKASSFWMHAQILNLERAIFGKRPWYFVKNRLKVNFDFKTLSYS